MEYFDDEWNAMTFSCFYREIVQIGIGVVW